MKRMLFSVAVFSLLASGIALAQMNDSAAKLSGQPTASEAPFVDSVSKDLQARFATTAQATKAGYYRFTNEDETGAISWTNGAWTSADPKHPSMLWYDVNGRLIGADYSVRLSDSSAAPTLWGVDPKRWGKIPSHVHFGIKQADGTIKYGGVGPKTLAKTGGSVVSPTKQMIVKAGLAKSVDDVAFVFPYVGIWDLQVWVIPNPSGAFAEMNPNVKPSHPSKEM